MAKETEGQKMTTRVSVWHKAIKVIESVASKEQLPMCDEFVSLAVKFLHSNTNEFSFCAIIDIENRLRVKRNEFYEDNPTGLVVQHQQYLQGLANHCLVAYRKGER